MKQIIAISTAILSLSGIVGCGSTKEASEISGDRRPAPRIAGGDSFYISPLNDKSKCLQMVPTTEGFLAVLGTCSGISPARVRYMDGSPYRPRQDGHVTISIEGQCLTNPTNFSPSDDGRLVFKPCNDDGREYGLRQMIAIARNQHGATRIASNLQYYLNRPSPKSECMERPTPNAVKRQICNNLNNWMLWQ